MTLRRLTLVSLSVLALSGGAFAQMPVPPANNQATVAPNDQARRAEWEHRRAELERHRAEREAQLRQIREERDRLVSIHEEQDREFHAKMEHLKQESERIYAEEKAEHQAFADRR